MDLPAFFEDNLLHFILDCAGAMTVMFITCLLVFWMFQIISDFKNIGQGDYAKEIFMLLCFLMLLVVFFCFFIKNYVFYKRSWRIKNKIVCKARF